MDTKSIVVAIDGSDNSGAAVRAAAGLAEATGRALKLLYVHPIENYAPLLGVIDGERLKELRVQQTREAFDAALAHLPAVSRKVEEISLWGDPAAEIIAYMKDNPGVHLVMGKRGLSKIKSLLLGSVSDKVVRHASGVVTVVGE